ncbi:MAG: diheme cytochrome c [Rhodospirillales bacterium]|nr:diheme cytochrome c [Rhodospirillales bacterium]
MRPILTTALAAALLGTTVARADDTAPVTHEPTRKECGECHMAFQPAFLPARSWTAMMAGLADHFGEDASLPEDTARSIRDYLTANAGDRVSGKLARKYMRWVAPDGAPQRITENPAFVKEHRFRDEVWKLPQVGAKSNCPACHKQAELGLYDDD